MSDYQFPFSEQTLNAIHERKRTIKVGNQKRKYGTRQKVKHLTFFAGYDLFQFQVAVRPFIMKKHDISLQELEVLLYLYPIQFFTRDDFRILPTTSHSISMKSLVQAGWLEMAIKGFDKADVFSFSPKGHKVVRDYYKYMSGEKQISPTMIKQLYGNERKAGLNKKRVDLLERLKRIAKSRPSKFRRSLYKP